MSAPAVTLWRPGGRPLESVTTAEDRPPLRAFEIVALQSAAPYNLYTRRRGEPYNLYTFGGRLFFFRRSSGFFAFFLQSSFSGGAKLYLAAINCEANGNRGIFCAPAQHRNCFPHPKNKQTDFPDASAYSGE
jgi:hypothetical protein